MAFSEYSFTSLPPSRDYGSNPSITPVTSANLMKMDSRVQRPNKPLIVKCTFDRSMRRITFSSAQNCSWDLLRTRVEQCFSLYASSFIITYKDDDGEITDINSDDDLTEAIQYFHLGDDGTNSAYGGSTYSGYSSRSSGSGSSRKITLRVDVQVDYDGPSLSDTASLSSLEEYKDKNGSRGSDDGGFSLVSGEGGSLRNFGREIGVIEEDAMTISSRPTIAAHSTGDGHSNGFVKVPSQSKSIAGSATSTESFSLLHRHDEVPHQLQLKTANSSTTLLPSELTPIKEQKKPDLPIQTNDVFERLKAAETTPLRSPTSPSSGRGKLFGSTPSAGGGTAQWLKEQSVQMIQSVLGGLHTAPSTKAPSVSDIGPGDEFSLTSDLATEEQAGGILKEGHQSDEDEQNDIPGSLELELGKNGKSYYYTYTGSSMSHVGDEHEPEPQVGSSREVDKQPVASTSSRHTSVYTDHNDSMTPLKDAGTDYFPEMPPEGNEDFKQYLPPSQSSDTLVSPDPNELTECSNCSMLLDTFRYVCATCGPRPPRGAVQEEEEEEEGEVNGKGKGRATPAAYTGPEPSTSRPEHSSPLSVPTISPGMASQSSPNLLQPSSSPSFSDMPSMPGAYSPQRPLHDYVLHSHGHSLEHGHSPGHRQSHSHGSPFPGLLHPPGPPIGLGMAHHMHFPMHGPPGHLPHHPPHHPYPHPPPQFGPSSSFPPPLYAPPPFPMGQPPHQPLPSPGATSVWTTSEDNVHMTTFSPNINASSPSLHSVTSVDSTTGLLNQHQKPLPRLPHLNIYPPSYGVHHHHSPSSSISSHPPSQPPQSNRTPHQSPGEGSQQSEPSPALSIVEGFELCMDCMETAGKDHAAERANTGPDLLQTGVSPGGAGTSPYAERSPYGAPSPGGSLFAAQRPSGSGSSTRSAGSGSWSRSGSRKKSQLRHAFKELVWTSGGWTDVEHDDISKCTTCGSELTAERYKCAVCLNMVVCRGCYSQIHEIHPIHAFLTLPEKKQQQISPPAPDPDAFAERSFSHEGIKCSHCLMEIVGARFHCAICPSVDICSNCESVGLPGNLTSPDGGHDSSHIMIKVPFPLSANEVDAASRKALSLWTGRDGPNVQTSRGSQSDGARRPGSNGVAGDSNYADTVIGASGENSSNALHRMDHGMDCNGCGRPIIGVRYQCAGCPSADGQGYSLCVNCEVRSYLLHDPMHCFFKIPRPVDRKIQEDEPLLPPLYILAAGELLDELPPGSRNDPRAYLQTIVHRVALCDRCIQRIVGEWYHCAYCAKDLCDACEAMDSHDASHFFVVFKSVVDMSILRTLTDVDNPQDSRPLIGYPVYTRPF